MRRWIALLVILWSGCGRIGFDIGSSTSDARGDGTGGVISGLIAWYTLDELAAGSYRDQVANNNATCAATCPSPAAGHIEGGQFFDGALDCLIVPYNSTLTPGSITLSAWANQSAVGGMSVLAKPYVGDGNSWQLETDVPSTSETLTLSTALSGSNNTYTTTPNNSRTNNAWHHLAGTYDGTMKRVYIDGVEQASQSAGAAVYDSSDVAIGCDINATGMALRFTGVIDEVQIYDHALSASQIAQLASQ